MECGSIAACSKASRTARPSNAEVPNRPGKVEEVPYKIKRRKLRYFGQVMKNEKYSFLRLMMQGKIEERFMQKCRKTS